MDGNTFEGEMEREAEAAEMRISKYFDDLANPEVNEEKAIGIEMQIEDELLDPRKEQMRVQSLERLYDVIEKRKNDQLLALHIVITISEILPMIKDDTVRAGYVQKLYALIGAGKQNVSIYAHQYYLRILNSINDRSLREEAINKLLQRRDNADA